MNKVNSVILFFIIFVIAAVILRFVGIINISGIELLSYLFMISGVAAVYTSFGKDRKGVLFIASTLFLAGILIFINVNFDLDDARNLVFPSVLFMIGIGFFLLYLDEIPQKFFLYISLIFLSGGILYFLFLRSTAFTGFFASLWNLVSIYWPVLVISAGIILILSRDKS